MKPSTIHLISSLVTFAVLFTSQACSPTYYAPKHGDTGEYQYGSDNDGLGLEHIQEQIGGTETPGGNRTMHVRSDLSGGYSIEDASGIKQGELEKKPGGGYKITNAIGEEIGELEPNATGGYDIENQFGRDVGNVERNYRGGYDVTDPYGREVKHVEPDIGGGYDVRDASEDDQ